MLEKVRQKRVSLLLVFVMIVTTLLSAVNPVLLKAAESVTKKEIVKLQFSNTADESNGIFQVPDSLPYTGNGTTVETNATYAKLDTSKVLRATNWNDTAGKYWQLSFSPIGFENYTLSFKTYASNTGPRDFKLQYSTDNSIWSDVGESGYTVTTGEKTLTFDLNPELSNLDNLYIRMVTTSLISARAGTGTYPATDPVQAAGVNNINSIILTGTPVEGYEPGGNVEPVTSNRGEDSLISPTDEIVLYSPTVVTGSAVIVTGGAINFSVNDGGYNTYTGPFTLADYGADEDNTDFTIDAYAELDGVESTHSRFHYYTKEPDEGSSVPDPISEEMVTNSGASSIDEIYGMASTGTATVIGQVAYKYGNVYNGANSINTIILQDVIDGEIIGLQVYDTAHSYTVGDIVTVTGKAETRYGVRQISDVTAVNKIAGAEPFKPQVLTIAQLLAGGDKYLSEYVLIQNAALDAYNSSGYTTVTDAAGSISLYKGALLPEGMKEGDKINLLAAWSKYNSDYQLRNGDTLDYIVLSPDGTTVDTSIILPMASWAGTGPVTASVVYADKYTANDYLDTSASLAHSSGKVPLANNGMGIGTAGSTEGTYYQLDLDSRLYGNIRLSYAMKGSGTGPKNFKVLYSTDGSTWGNATAANLSITAVSTMQNFSVTLPGAANNAEKLYIRIQVADSVSINNGTIGSGGTNYLNDIKITGSPVVAGNIAGYPDITPDAGEVRLGDEITITSSTPDAVIHYSFDGVIYYIYDSNNKPVFSELPATITAYATKDGLTDSLWITYGYTQAQVAPVKANPNGGARTAGTKVALSCATEGAQIQYSYDGGKTWINYNTENQITLDKLPVTITAKAVLTGYKDSETSEFKYDLRQNENYNIYFGQLHSHTDYSDGAGTCDQAFDYAKNTAKQIDFLAVTDHSNSFDNADKASLADGSVSEEWKEGHALAEQYTDNTFVGLYGFEMTWSNGLGHINTFNTPGFQSRTQSNYSTYSTALSNYYATLKTETQSISQFNHPGTTFGDFSDFDHYDEDIDSLINLIEVGNGEGAIGSSGYFPSYEYYTRALDKGWHVAPTNNQDNHKGYWGDSNTARTVVLADSLTRDNIYDALRNRRVYATEDNDLGITYTLNGEIMGSILEEKTESADIKVELEDPTDSAIGKVEVIVNGGLSIADQTVNTNRATVEFKLPADYSYYYIRVTQPDKNIAVTAPVWAGDVESVGISKISTTAVLPVKGESLDINTELFNNEDRAFDIDSIDYSINNEVIHSVDLAGAGLTSLEAFTSKGYSFHYTYNDAGKVTIDVTVTGSLDGVSKVYKGVLKLTYVDPGMVTKVVIDGTHYNDYVTGYYGGRMGNFTQIAAGENIKVSIERNRITPEILADCDLLIISAPAKKTATDNAGDYAVSHFEDEFIDLVKSYTGQGGTVIICGLADYQDSADAQTATEVNKLLSVIGATTRLNSDEAVDDTNNGGQAYRLYLTDYNKDSDYTKGVVDGQIYSAYSGCTLLLDNTAVNAGKVQYLIKGHSTTYSIDSRNYDSNYQAINKGDAVLLAREQLAGGSNVFIAGTVFMSDFEVKAEMDNIWDLPYINKNIIVNILDSIKKQVAVTPIAAVRAGTKGEIYSVEGTVTAGTETDNTFFDTIYIQDATGGINIFPINEGVIEVGQKVRVVGYLDQYLGDTELRVITAEVTDTAKNPVQPTVLTTKQAMDYAANGGKLVKVQGKVTNVIKKNGIVETIMLKDSSGTEARVFIDGYIKYSDSTGKALEDIAVKDNEISAVGLVSYDPDGERLRVRDRSEIRLVKAGGSGSNGNNNSNRNGTSGSKGTSNSETTVVVDEGTNTRITTTITNTTDSNGNTVITTVTSLADLTTGKTLETVTETVTTDRLTGTTVTSTLVKDDKGTVTKAAAVVNLKTNEITKAEDTAVINAGLMADTLIKVAGNTTEEIPLSVIVNLPGDTLNSQLKIKEMNGVEFRLTIPAALSENSKIMIRQIIAPETVIKEAKEQRKDLKVTVYENGREAYSWSFNGGTLHTSPREVTGVNMALTVLPIREAVQVYNLVRPHVPESAKDEGVVLNFMHSGILPDRAHVNVYVGNHKGMETGRKVYVYYYNDHTESGTKTGVQPSLDEGKKVETTVDKNGCIQVDIMHCSSYVVLPVKPDSDIVSTLFDQITVPAAKTIYTGKSQKLGLKLPLEAEDAVITYASSQKSVAAIYPSGNISPKKAGTTTITAKVTINGITKTFKTGVTVKEPYITLTKKTESLKVGNSFIFAAKAYGVSGNFSWSSSDNNIAAITKDGRLKAKKAGIYKPLTAGKSSRLA